VIKKGKRKESMDRIREDADKRKMVKMG